MKLFYRSHQIECNQESTQVVWEIYENLRGHLRMIVAGFLHGHADLDSVMIRLKARVDQLMAEPPAVMPSMWAAEFAAKHEEF